MHLSPQERDKLLIHVAADLARQRRARGLRLNYPEAVATISAYLLEGARDGRTVVELMEAGRAMQRGLVSPDRTTLIASSHRAYAVSEKIVPGDGAGDPAKVYEAARAAAKQFIAFDMASLTRASANS